MTVVLACPGLASSLSLRFQSATLACSSLFEHVSGPYATSLPSPQDIDRDSASRYNLSTCGRALCCLPEAVAD